MREAMDWPHSPFTIPADIYASWDARERGSEAELQWRECLEAYRTEYPDLADEFMRRTQGALPDDWSDKVAQLIAEVERQGESIATRKASQNALEALGGLLPELLGGSADLAGSNLTIWSGSEGIQDNPAGNYIYYGVREFGMAAIANGIALHGGFKPYSATFLVFSEYARNALRMAALMHLPNIFVFTHDSIGLGEDGPTHQAVEQVATLRMIPHMSVWRPCDTVESMVAWKVACERREGPTSLLFSRQALPHSARDAEQIANIQRGGYTLIECAGPPQLIFIATGSEVQLAVAAAEQLAQHDVRVRVVSMPSTDYFDAQEEAYRESVLPRAVRARVAIEAASRDYWRKYVGLDGEVVGIDSFGVSAPADHVFAYFGFDVERVVAVATHVIDNAKVGSLPSF